MRAALKYDFCDFSIFENFIIAVMHEGVTVLPKHNSILIDLVEKYFKNRSFAYITNRINSYSVDPKVFEETSKIKNLVAFAVVSQSDVRIANASFEKQFLSKPHKSFTKLIDAIAWCEQLVEESKNKS
ncbi:MAG: hypothetical protein NXH73_10640 [Flavobacteriaceae bacterium]|nr:hypothetical protein [Flavobacteriaceae bacterium]